MTPGGIGDNHYGLPSLLPPDTDALPFLDFLAPSFRRYFYLKVPPELRSDLQAAMTTTARWQTCSFMLTTAPTGLYACAQDSVLILTESCYAFIQLFFTPD